jgi:hypothetical protein
LRCKREATAQLFDVTLTDHAGCAGVAGTPSNHDAAVAQTSSRDHTQHLPFAEQIPHVRKIDFEIGKLNLTPQQISDLWRSSAGR